MLTSENFDEIVLKGKGPIAVEFMSYSCSHCRAMEPILERVAEMMSSTEKVFQVDMANDQDLGNRYKVRGTPTFTMFLNGKKVGQVEGPDPILSTVLSAVAEPFRLLN